MGTRPLLGSVSPRDALQHAIGFADPPAEIEAVERMDDDSARVVYVAPSRDPTDPDNQAALESITAGFVVMVKHHPRPPSRMTAVGRPPDEADEALVHWHVEQAWAERLAADDWGPMELLARIAETSDAVVVTDE